MDLQSGQCVQQMICARCLPQTQVLGYSLEWESIIYGCDQRM